MIEAICNPDARTTKHVVCGAALALALILSERASAEVTAVAQNGFEIRDTIHVAAAPDKVYGTLIVPALWWDPGHTFSGSASNLTLDAHAGGCWCEKLADGGSVQHLLTVAMAAPGKLLRLRGALGPAQGLGVDGAMTWSLKQATGGTDLTFTYDVGGFDKDGFEKISKAADTVLSEQLSRLQKYVETGSPDTAPQQEKKP